jgi:hypothetical protein
MKNKIMKIKSGKYQKENSWDRSKNK